MTPILQTLIVFVVLAIALGFLGRSLWLTMRAKSGCGCGSKTGCAKMMDAMRQSERRR